MLIEVLKLVKYKSWVNNITFSAISDISEFEISKKRDTNYNDILSTLNHIYVIDDIFKSHLLNQTHAYTSRNTKKCPDFQNLWNQQKLIDQWYIDFISTLNKKELNKIVSFEFVGGGLGRMSIIEIIFHIVNHGTYHRGFVSDMMYQIPSIPPQNDYTIYIRDVYRADFTK